MPMDELRTAQKMLAVLIERCPKKTRQRFESLTMGEFMDVIRRDALADEFGFSSEDIDLAIREAARTRH